MKKIFLVISLVLLAIVLVVTGIIITKSFTKQNTLPKIPFVSINGRMLENNLETIQDLRGIAKLSIQAHTESITIRKVRGSDTPSLRIKYRNDSMNELEFLPEKGIFTGGDTSITFIDHIEAVIPPGIEINIRQKSTNITLEGLSGGSVFINSRFLTLNCSDLVDLKALAIITENGTLTFDNSSVDKLDITANCGELSIVGLKNDFASMQLNKVNALVSNSTFKEFKADIESGYFQIEKSNIRHLNNISKENILWLLSNEISKADFAFRDASINLKGNLISKISADGKNSIIRTDTSIPEKLINGSDNTIIYSPVLEDGILEK